MTFGGTILGTTSNSNIQSSIDWYYETNAEKNSTEVLAKLYYRRTNYGYTTGGTGSFTITINGTTISKSGVKLEISTSKVEAMSASVIVQHAVDGTKSISISATGSLPPSSLTYTNCGGTVALPKIPRESTITCTTANIGSNPTITISKASPSFTHTITWAFGSLSGTVKENTSATTITDWTIPEEFYTQIPDEKTGQGTLYCTTYSGGTALGTTRCDLIVGTDETKCKPTVSGAVSIDSATNQLTGRTDTLIRYFSTATCTISTTLNKSAGSITAKTINNVAVSGNTLTIPNVETGVFEFWAKDSREYHNNDKETRTLVPYIKLTNDAAVYRDDPTSGNATLQIEGNYYSGSFGAQENSLTVEYKIGNGDYIPVTPTIKDGEYSATVSLTGLDYTKAFNIEVVVKDKLDSVTKPMTLLKGIPVFDWGENDFNFNVPVTINGVNILEKLAELESLISQ